jgi:hypothetical protein
MKCLLFPNGGFWQLVF